MKDKFLTFEEVDKYVKSIDVKSLQSETERFLGSDERALPNPALVLQKSL